MAYADYHLRRIAHDHHIAAIRRPDDFFNANTVFVEDLVGLRIARFIGERMRANGNKARVRRFLRHDERVALNRFICLLKQEQIGNELQRAGFHERLHHEVARRRRRAAQELPHDHDDDRHDCQNQRKQNQQDVTERTPMPRPANALFLALFHFNQRSVIAQKLLFIQTRVRFSLRIAGCHRLLNPPYGYRYRSARGNAAQTRYPPTL